MSYLMLLADGASRVTYESARWQSFDEWWQPPLLIALCLTLAAFVVFMYRRDSVELRPGIAPLLMLLRLAALAGIGLYFLDFQKRSEREVVHDSRVLLLVDTSLSMGRRDTGGPTTSASPTRIDQVVDELADGDLIGQLRKTHEVEVFRFDRQAARIALLEKEQPAADAEHRPAAADNWQKNLRQRLVPRGIESSETRLGEALRQVIAERRATPLAGIVVFSDGGQNAGVDHSPAVELARESKLPIYPVGIGSNQQPVNVRVSDFLAPARAYPGEKFTATAYVQSQGLEGRTATVELYAKPAGKASSKNTGPGELKAAKKITLGASGIVTPVQFEVAGIPQPARHVLRLEVRAPAEDRAPADNQQEVDIEVVERKNHVLLVAGGPSREYQFLRNQLRRDKEMVVDVLLQTAAGEGVSQDARKILEQFPSTLAEISEYDCIVAFDPDWRKLDENQINLLERWVAERSGGLIVVAGPVYTDLWTAEPKLGKVRGLYPVEFSRQLALYEDGKFGSKTPWPIAFTREGMEAEFLWLADSMTASQQAWESFEGVYGYYQVRGAKPGATIYGRYSDPDATLTGELPIYMAGQFYGSGRVFFLGSGEMWRLRSVDEGYFEQFYTKCIRHVSQGRLLRGSRKDTLLVEQDRYVMGSTVTVRAQLADAQHEPLAVPQVPLAVFHPDGALQTLTLKLDPTRKGMYAAQFAAMKEGVYRLELDPPESEEEPLTHRIQVRVPDLESEKPQRNDALLKEIADRTGGRYYIGLAAALGREGVPPLVPQLQDRTESTYVAESPDLEWQHDWMRWLLLGICGCLCLEWLIRRLCRLA